MTTEGRGDGFGCVDGDGRGSGIWDQPGMLYSYRGDIDNGLANDHGPCAPEGYGTHQLPPTPQEVER
jgi:hypothetical protein